MRLHPSPLHFVALLLLFPCLSSVNGQEVNTRQKASKAKPSTIAKNDPGSDVGAKPEGNGKNAAPADGGARGDREKEKDHTAYDFGLPTADGKNLPLSDYKGKVLLIVNLGRESSYASQLPALQKLNDTFKDKGLVVLGVPSNDFGNAEPGTPGDIAKFYTDAKVDFPVMQVSSLTGVHELPLFTYLAKNKAVENDGLHWNYTKFLVDRKGKVIVCFPPEVAPDSLAMMATVQEVLDGTWKPKKASEGRGKPGGDEDDGPE